ncbi:MAG: ABC transporter ATP-binding protein [Candidatus Aerophobetes bacterium]|nr:ABC transporter ATP-binding protein [Candidatus Aerophobetes bacterium]
MLRVNNIDVYYRKAIVLEGVSLEIREGEVVALVGANGAGKTTMLKTISGLLSPKSGKIEFKGQRMDGYPPNKIVELGISQVPEGRHVFEKLSVKENLLLGAYTVLKKGLNIKESLDWICELFPVLKEKEKQPAGTLSGGEQQMLVIGRALMSEPKLLMLDEPSLGLMPTFVKKVFEAIETINNEGTTILLVEQNVKRALDIAKQGYVLQNGKMVISGEAGELLETDVVRKAYLGL